MYTTIIYHFKVCFCRDCINIHGHTSNLQFLNLFQELMPNTIEKERSTPIFHTWICSQMHSVDSYLLHFKSQEVIKQNVSFTFHFCSFVFHVCNSMLLIKHRCEGHDFRCAFTLRRMRSASSSFSSTLKTSTTCEQIP